LMDQKLATAFVTATDSSLTQVCECAALITVASMSKEQVNSLAAGDKAAVNRMANEVSQNYLRCFTLN